MSKLSERVRLRDYRGKDQREYVWTYDTGITDPSDHDSTLGVRFEVSYRKGMGYRAVMQQCAISEGSWRINYGLRDKGGHAREEYEHWEAARFSEKTFMDFVGQFPDESVEALCRDFALRTHGGMVY